MSYMRDFLMLSTRAHPVTTTMRSDSELENYDDDDDLQLSLGQLNNVERSSSNNSNSFLPTLSCNKPNATLNENPCYSTATDHSPFWHSTGLRHMLSVHHGVLQPLLLYPQHIFNPNQENHRYCPYPNPNLNALRSNSTLRRNGRGSTTLYRSSGSGGNMDHLSELIGGRSRYMHEIGVMPILEQEAVNSASRIPAASQLPSIGGHQYSNANVDGMPCVSTIGANGRSARGILYKFDRREFRIMCVCHGRSFSPGGFVRHAGTIESSNPLRQIMIVPY